MHTVVARRRRQRFLREIDMKIVVEKGHMEILDGFDSIKGHLHIRMNTSGFYEFENLRVCLEGFAKTKFETKVEAKPTQHQTEYRFMPEKDDSSDSSLAVCLLNPQDPKLKRSFTGEKSYSFPFELKLNGQSFPASFKGAHGGIQYKIMAYSSVYNKDVVSAEKIIPTRGYLNLARVPSLSQPLTFSKTKKKSFFSKRTLLKSDLLVNQRGFLPGEECVYTLSVDNPICLTITAIQVSFVQKINYYADGNLKPTVVILSTQDMNMMTEDNHGEEGNSDGFVQFRNSFTFPKNLMPTFPFSNTDGSTSREQKTVEIMYTLQFSIAVSGKSQMKGEVNLIVGTTRSSPGEEGKSSVVPVQSSSTTNANTYLPNSDSNWDVMSIQTVGTLPPSYSTLSSRRASLETLPPNYNSIWEIADEAEEDSSSDVETSFSKLCT